MKLYLPLVALMAMASVTGSATILEPQEALQRCFSSLPARYAPSRHDAELVQTVQAMGREAVYVFDNGRGGFLAVSASDATTPLLGYGTMALSHVQLPDNMQGYLETLAQEVALIEAGDATFATWSDNNPAIEPMIESAWGQGMPFNSFCPKIGTKRTAAGCVAVSLSQIMNKYKYPAHGTGSFSYDLVTDSDTIAISADFEAIPFEWDSIIPVYKKDEYTQAQADAVGTLIYSTGVATKMQYGVKESATTDYQAGKALLTYFNYDKSITPDRKLWHSPDEWNQVIYDQLAAGRPVYMAGSGSKGGHAFVCDGYDKDGYFHFNWGWSGNCDGYFLLTLLSPETSVAGNGFNKKVNIVKNIMPDQGNPVHSPVLALMGDLKTVDETYNRANNEKVKLGDTESMTFLNYGYVAAKDLDFMLRLVNVNDTTDVRTVEAFHSNELKPMFGYKFITFFSASIPKGHWTATIYYTLNGEPYELKHNYNAITMLDLVSTETELTVSQQSGISSVMAPADNETVYYDLYGRKVANPTDGIYIRVHNRKATKIIL